MDHSAHHGGHGDHMGHGMEDTSADPTTNYEVVDYSHGAHNFDHNLSATPTDDHVTVAAAADHSGHHMGHMDHSGHTMMMYFHGGFDEVIMFDFWRISGIGGLIGSMIGCFLLSVVYEGLKFFRESIVRRSFKRAKEEEQNGNAQQQQMGKEVEEQQVKCVETNMWSKVHVFLSLLHVVQLTVAYFMMLIFMSYNSWLCAATVLGAGFGHFLFGWRKTTVLNEPDHCH